MRISDTTHLSIGEKFVQAAQEEQRKSEKALTQASGVEMGLGREENNEEQSRVDVAASTDTLNLSETALARYRAVSGDNAGGRESFTRQNYLQSKALEKKLQAAREESAKRRQEELERMKNGEEAEDPIRSAAPKAKGPGLRGSVIDVTDSFGMAYGDMSDVEQAMDSSGADGEGFSVAPESEKGKPISGSLAGVSAGGGKAAEGMAGAENSADAAIEAIRDQIRELQEQLGEAQARVAELAARMQQQASAPSSTASTGDAGAVATPTVSSDATGAPSVTGGQSAALNAGTTDTAMADAEAAGQQAPAAAGGAAGEVPMSAPSMASMGMDAQALALQAELAAAQVEVAEISSQLQQSNEELMKLLKEQQQ